MGDDTEKFEKEMAYDLRKVYAVDLVGEHLKDIAEARKADNYSLYFKNLKDLFVITQHKFKDKTNKIDEYNDLITNAVKIINSYPNDFLGSSKNPNACAEIEACLNAIEMFLYSQLEDADVFGAKYEDEGL